MKTQKILALFMALVMALALLAAFPAVSLAEEENVALNKPTYANGNKKDSAKITDGDLTTAWTTAQVPKYVEVDLQSNYNINKIVVTLKSDYKVAFNVYGSTDGVNFDRLYYMTEPALFTAKNGSVTVTFDQPVCYRVIRMMTTMTSKGSSSSSTCSEIEVYGTVSDTPVTPTRTSIDIDTYDEWLLKNHGVDLSKIKDAEGKYDIKDTYTAQDTVEALQGLVTRILGAKYVDWFEFEVGAPLASGNDYYEISNRSGKIHIKGNEGVSIAVGLNYYLKYFCNVHVSQETEQVRMPENVVAVDKTIRTETPCTVRYSYNYCTLSYTMSYYGFDEWQRELDYLMLSGINVVLDTTATEALWVLYLQNYGYSVQEAIEFVCGYTWKAWWLMGNLESTGGPVSDNWIIDTVELARVNQRYLAVMGADPCLQIFSGTLPTDFADKANATLTSQGYADVKNYMTGTGSWCGHLRPYSLNTTFPGFESMAKTFYEVQDSIYGRIGDYYAGDFLHEVDGGFKLDPSFVKADMSRKVLDLVIEENDEAVWVIQSWWENPLPEVVAGWGADREEHILLLDLAAAQSPRWTNTDRFGGYEFGGSSWCYCTLENYGGRTGMHGRLTQTVQKMMEAKKTARHMKGIGFTSEASERNPVYFDLWWELAWTSGVTDYSSWTAEWLQKYVARRYGPEADKSYAAWKNLMEKSLYGTGTADGTTINYAINNYPKFDYTGGYFVAGYRLLDMEKAIVHMYGDYSNLMEEETYVYDMIDLYRTHLSNMTTLYLERMFKYAKTADYEKFHAYKTQYLRAMMLIDELSSYYQKSLYGNWIGRVDVWAEDERTGNYSDFDIDLMKLDAGMLITNWSTIDLGNYAYRQYNGLMEDYYYTMWKNFLNAAEDQIKRGVKITDGGTTLGISNTGTNYNIGRQTILNAMYSDRYLSAPVPVEGDETHRSLKEVIDEIRRDFSNNSDIKLNTATPKKDSGLTVADGILSGTVSGSDNAAAISGLFETTAGGRVVFFTDKGQQPVEDTAAVEQGMKVAIMEDDGSVLELNITVGEIKAGNPADRDPSVTGYKAFVTEDAVKLYICFAEDGYGKTVEITVGDTTESKTVTADGVEVILTAEQLSERITVGFNGKNLVKYSLKNYLNAVTKLESATETEKAVATALLGGQSITEYLNKKDEE